MQSLVANPDSMLSKDTSPVKDVIPEPKVPELDGPSGPEPTRYGDWERRGRCIDF